MSKKTQINEVLSNSVQSHQFQSEIPKLCQSISVQTSCSENSPLLNKNFKAKKFDQIQFSINQFKLEQQTQENTENTTICKDFQLNWHCQNGLQCQKIHQTLKQKDKLRQRQRLIFKQFFLRFPQLLIFSKARNQRMRQLILGSNKNQKY